ncbi:SusC/RagA family TonB-linked outer membrane protein [Dyadobacter sediminis]|uniref:TonB-dependent receptor n=2 Tax=Dyadobacter sediminis TaxID=1493691 RepID=A0A5R9K828_9BACT|nr:TonB-dependent receptor [Dyadobacter sediminis]TLU90033.1 TonB-dependent receptor [Dyadobacter sediminis]
MKTMQKLRQSNCCASLYALMKNSLAQIIFSVAFAGFTYAGHEANDWKRQAGETVFSENQEAMLIQVTGKITDESNAGLPGVSVVLKGTQKGTTTDSEGMFKLDVPDESAVLVMSFVGYVTQEITVGSQSNLSVSLVPENTALKELVVVGYGTQKKINLTGAVATVGADQVANRPVTNMSSALQGVLPGVTVVQRSGQPGRDTGEIRVRGVGSMNNASPMVVVDGLISSMENLNPNDIESISVLKDASAGAIYGSRAANGVILVTTKRGKSGKPVVSYNAYIGMQKPTNLPDYLGSYEYGKLLNEGLVNEGQQPRFTEAEIEKFRNGSDPANYPDTDWLDLLYKGSGIQQSHNLSISGGSDASRYLLSFGYLNQKGLIKNTDNDRYNVRFNLDSKISDRLSVGLTSSFIRQGISEPSAIATGQGLNFSIVYANRIPPTVPNKYPDGSWMRYLDGNPNAWIENGGSIKDQISNGMGNAFAELIIFKGLKLRGSAGADFYFNDKKTHLKDLTYGDGSYQGPNSVRDDNFRNSRITLQAFLTYEKSFGSHNLNVLLGSSRETYNYRENGIFRRNLPSNELTDVNAGSTEGMTASGLSYESKLGSYFGRINYDYQGKYLLEASVRYDGSSKFAADKRWGVFPSFSAGWRISEEAFLKNVQVVSDLKLRGSYGSVGNNNINDYLYIPTVALGVNYPFNGGINAGAAQQVAANPNLQWEKSTTFDIGADLALFNNKLSLTADYYNRYTDNILVAVPVSSIYGLPAPTVNAGAMRNKGIELVIGHANRLGDFSYNVSFNVGINRNNVEKYANPAKTKRIQAEGYPWNAFFGYEAAGFYQTDEQVQTLPKVVGSPVQKGDLIFKDQNNDGVINGNDRIDLGSDIPKTTYGLNLTARFKNFDLVVLGQGAADVKQYLQDQVQFAFVNGYKAQTKHLDRWTPETPDARFPKTHVSQWHNYAISSFSVVNASYLRLKNLQIGYSISPKVLQAVKISSLRVYLSGQNLLTFTKLDSGFDPESAENAQFGYPNVKVYTAGLNINF